MVCITWSCYTRSQWSNWHTAKLKTCLSYMYQIEHIPPPLFFFWSEVAYWKKVENALVWLWKSVEFFACGLPSLYMLSTFFQKSTNWVLFLFLFFSLFLFSVLWVCMWGLRPLYAFFVFVLICLYFFLQSRF